MRLAALSFIAALLFSSSSLCAQEASFKISADYVKVPVTVFDPQGRLLTDLTRDDFQLYDEGELQPIRNFLLSQAPLHVMLLLDSSGSLQEELDEIRTAAVRFAGSFTEDDRICVISFSDEVKILQDWTNRFGRLKKALHKLKRGYRTALYDALQETVHSQFESVQDRKVIILLTDGLDNESTSSYESVIQALIQEDVTLYIVSRTRLVEPKVKGSKRVEFLNRVMKNVLEDDGDFVDIYFREKETAMRQLAETSGGRVFFPRELTELGESYRQVSRELKQQYVLTFQPPAVSDKRFREIEVLCDREVGQLHFRRQYSWPLRTGRLLSSQKRGH